MGQAVLPVDGGSDGDEEDDDDAMERTELRLGRDAPDADDDLTLAAANAVLDMTTRTASSNHVIADARRVASRMTY